MLNFDSVFISSDNPQRLISFYEKVIGESPRWSGGGYAGFNLGNAGLMIGPHDKVTGKSSNPERVMFNLVTDDVEAEYKRLIDSGASSVAEPYHPGNDTNSLIATLADPDGNYFQLMTPMQAEIVIETESETRTVH